MSEWINSDLSLWNVFLNWVVLKVKTFRRFLELFYNSFYNIGVHLQHTKVRVRYNYDKILCWIHNTIDGYTCNLKYLNYDVQNTLFN